MVWLKKKNKIQVSFKHEYIVLNNYKGHFSKLINMHILIAKFYIYRTKVQSNVLNFIDMLSHVNKIRTIEKIIARKRNKILQYDVKWLDD